MSYRMYFLAMGRVAASLPLEADNNTDALTMAAVLHEACSEHYDDFELWRDQSVIVRHGRAAAATVDPKAFERLSPDRQAWVLEKEEALLDSQLRVATSRRLVERVDTLRREMGRKTLRDLAGNR